MWFAWWRPLEYFQHLGKRENSFIGEIPKMNIQLLKWRRRFPKSYWRKWHPKEENFSEDFLVELSPISKLPWGEDMDFLINAKMFCYPLYPDNQLPSFIITHPSRIYIGDVWGRIFIVLFLPNLSFLLREENPISRSQNLGHMTGIGVWNLSDLPNSILLHEDS